MTYSLHITSTAEHDIANACDHIEFELMNPKASNDLLDVIEKKLNTLTLFPEKFALVDDTLLASWGIRFTQIKNYLAFYTVSKENYQIIIIRFLYEKSNWKSILKHGFSPL